MRMEHTARALNDLTDRIIGAAIHVHRALGPGLLESAYEACLQSTSSRNSPWYVVPADDKRNARLIVSRVIVDTLKRLGLGYPKADPKRRRELRSLRRLLAR